MVEMEIPDTGAVFTLGKSYLSENHQSYFFIKNDPIRKVITGDNQSAVICESGRLFVWGENQYGQLSAGSKEVITKPSCVKEIKNLGYKVRNIAFGEAFSVILTENNKVFFNGKSIFALNETTFGNKFRNCQTAAHCVIRYNYELIDFQKRCLDDQGNLDDLVDIVAGKTHFVVLTNSGKLYFYGILNGSKVKRHINSSVPKRISEHLVARIAKCGTTFIVFVTDCNGVFLLGRFNEFEYPTIVKLNTSGLKDDTIYSIHVSKKDEIFLISSAGDVYKSTNDAEVQFERIILFNQNDNIRKFCSGKDFVCVLTDKHKFLTTFNEKPSIKNPTAIVRPPHELRKFHDLRILDIATGLHHILLFARSKSSASTSLDITSSDPNENIPINRLSAIESDAQLNQIFNEKRKSIDEQKNSLNSSISHNSSKSSKSILTKETLEAIQANKQIDKNPNNIEQIITKEKSFSIESRPLPNLDPSPNKEGKKPEKKEKEKEKEKENEELKLTTESIIIATELQAKSDKNSTENQSTFTNKNQTMDNRIGGAVLNIGDSIMSDIKSIGSFGEEKLNDLAKGAEMAVNEVAELPKNAIDYVKKSINADDKKDDELEATKDLPKQLTESNDNSMVMPEAIAQLHNDDSNQMKMDQQNEMDKVKQNNKLNCDTAEVNTIDTAIDNNIDGTINTDVKFIDNGVDISNTTNIIQAMKDEINEMSKDVKNKTDELTMKYDGIINDELNSTKEMVSNKLFQVKNVGEGIMKGISSAPTDLMTRIIPLKSDLEEIDLEGDGDTEQTTASIKSVSTPAKNQIDEDENMESMETIKEIQTPTMEQRENSSEGRVRRFFNGIKNNCKSADTVIEMEGNAENAIQHIKSQSPNDIIGDNKTSKICTIL